MLPNHRVQPDRQLSSRKLSALSFALVRGFQWALETNLAEIVALVWDFFGRVYP
jgi:hypothetical protein